VRRAWLLALLLACAAPLAQARPVQPGPVAAAPVWGQLSPRQQADLAWLERDWDRMPPERRAKILRRWERWQDLSPDEQRRLREGRRNFRELTPEQREAMRESFRALRALPPQEQKRLRGLWHGMTPQQRREWLRRGGPGKVPPPAPGEKRI
jgi:hypothetical protein